MSRRPSRSRWKAITWWWICDLHRHSGAMRSIEPGISRFRVRANARPGMTGWMLLRHRRSTRHHPSLPGVAHQRDKAVETVHELAVGHGDEQRKHHAEMQRE